MNIAIVGATGQVGRKMIQCVAEAGIEFDNLYLFASHRSKGKTLKINGAEFTGAEFKNNEIVVDDVKNWQNYNFSYALFSAGAVISKEYAPKMAENGVVVIDNSSAFRSTHPLIVSEVNLDDIKNNKLIANPNCTTMAAMPALKVLNDNYIIKRLVYSTYQAVSGAGIKGVQELENQVKSISNPEKLSETSKGIIFGKVETFVEPIAYNAVAYAGNMLESGNTEEEEKLINESRKILHSPDLAVSATCVRIPVFTGHSLSINVEFEKAFEIADLRDRLKNAKGVEVVELATPVKSVGKKGTFVSRIRRDESVKNGVNLWICADNLLKGAALNAVEILKELCEENG
jgi:aspartate-semialdehyde dehydrogenase